jgi:hypothetical protein
VSPEATLFIDPFKGGRTQTASRQVSRHETKETKADVSIMTPDRCATVFIISFVFNCAPFFASCRRHRVLTVTSLDACRCAAYLLLRIASPHNLQRWRPWWHTIDIRVRITLRLTVSQSVCLGVEPRLGHMIRYLFLLKVAVLSIWGALSDERSGLSFASHSRQ